MVATAEITVLDAEAVCEAAQERVVIELPSSGGAEDSESEPEDRPTVNSVLDAVAWLIWPTEGMEGPMEGGAFRVLWVESGVVAETDERGAATWTTTVKLTDVEQLRRIAAQAHPDAAALIAENVGIAWQYATDPFAPMRSIPGIAWQPGQVRVERVRSKAADWG